MTHLLLPSTVTGKLLIAQASYCRITKLRACLTPKCKKLNIRKCGVFADQVTNDNSVIICRLSQTCHAKDIQQRLWYIHSHTPKDLHTNSPFGPLVTYSNSTTFYWRNSSTWWPPSSCCTEQTCTTTQLLQLNQL